MNKPYPEVHALENPHRPEQLVVLLHGLGSNGDDLINLVPYIQPKLPKAHFIAPHGIEPYNMIPSGYQWFSFDNREIAALQQELKRTFPLTHSLIITKLLHFGLNNSQLILIGFSQGAMVSLYFTLMSDTPICTTIGFSGTCIIPKESPTDKKTTPICLIHGIEDEIIPFSSMDISSKYLSKLGFAVETHGIPNLGHSINLKGVEYAIDFILRQL